jgi:hypothetical protein
MIYKKDGQAQALHRFENVKDSSLQHKNNNKNIGHSPKSIC